MSCADGASIDGWHQYGPASAVQDFSHAPGDGSYAISPGFWKAGMAYGTPPFLARDRARQLAATLTEREAEVLAGLGEGLSNAQIAARLFLSEATVKGYVSRTLDKLGCANRTQAGLLAHDAGLVRP